MSRGVGIVVGVGISSFFPLTSSIIILFLLTSSIFLLNEELVKILVTRCKKINDESDGK